MIEALLIDPFREEDGKRLSDVPGFHIGWAKTPSREELEKAEVLLGLPTFEQLSAAKNLRWVQSPMAGVDFYAKKREEFPENVTLTNLSGAFGPSISEFALTMCLTLYKKTGLYRDNQRAHRWNDEGVQDSPAGKHLLILGAGDIGCETARLFKVFGCRITGLRRTARELPENFDEMITMEGLDKALSEADIVVSALPATEETKGLFDERRLSLLKPSAVLINVGRGNLIDTDALARHLADGRLLGAGLDVTDPEPLPEDHPLWDLPNVIITPHVSGGTFGHLKATEDALFDLCRKNMERYRDGEPLLNEVDLAAGYRKTENRYHP